LEKSTFARRKAQKLARAGEIAPAIEEMRLLVGEAETDPYDHVYLGDLLMRDGRPQEALDAWMAAVLSYERVGLNRNAVAVGKKVLRLDHGRVAMHRTLGELYCREGLLGEAMPHFLRWLDMMDGDARFSEEFLATLDRAASAVGLQVEAALRLGDHYVRVRQYERAARMLHGLADKVQTAGSPEMAAELRERARAAERAQTAEEGGESATSTAGDAMPPDALPAGEDAAVGLTREGSAPPDFRAMRFPAGGGTGDVESGSEDPFPEMTAAGPPAEFPAESPADLSAEIPADVSAESSGQWSVGIPTEFPAASRGTVPSESSVEPAACSRVDHSTESTHEPPEESPAGSPVEPLPPPSGFLVEHFPTGSSDLEFPAESSPDPTGGDSSRDDRMRGRDLPDTPATQSSINHSAPPGPFPGTGSEDGSADVPTPEGSEGQDALDPSEAAGERIWDLDAEEEALRFAPDVEDNASDLVGPDESGPVLPPPTGLGLAGASPVASAAPSGYLSDCEWDGVPVSAEGETHSVPLEISGPPPVTLRSLVDRAEAAYGSGQWAEARGLYDRAGHEAPLEPTVITRLVEIARKLGDQVAEVHYLEQLGDAWIEAGVMEEALEAFLEVLRIDPDCSTARRRLSRFREMGVPGAERIPEATIESVQGVLEAAGARLSVRDDPSSAIQSDEWIDLGALIEEFRDGIKNQIAGDDAPGHYDLAVSYHGMGLFEEAAEELDLVLACAGLAAETELRARELRGICLGALQRHREAVHEFRTALERPVSDPKSRCSLLYHLGMALESAGEWREAAETYGRVQDESAGFLDADARRQSCKMRANGIDPEARAA
jgi:tetratricopeptide (TPR) repeat protein